MCSQYAKTAANTFEILNELQAEVKNLILQIMCRLSDCERCSLHIYSHQDLVSCHQNIFINPQELILRPTAASEKSKVVAGKYIYRFTANCYNLKINAEMQVIM